jgi:CBS domain-containing protein
VEEVLCEEKVRYVCPKDVPVVPRGASLRLALEVLRRRESRGAVLIVDGAGDSPRLVAIFTERDYLDKVAGGDADLDAPAERYATPSPRTVSPDDTIDSAIRGMTDGGYRNLPVVDDEGRLVGLVTTRDLIQYLAEFFPKEVYNLPPRLHQNDRVCAREGG